ncbi:LysR family transcriptional regulator [Arenibacterium sp. LLYu02]|uniref:LysR family transcriptional regulator n=1 Tax=Arenibacterium sp. LLYu02 TaxID=3404132 RepID=UPI003B20D017
MRYFLAVVRHGSIRSASEALRINQSAISRQLQALEDDYGAALFDRHARGVRLTSAGTLLYDSAREVGFVADRVKADIDALQGLKRGHVRLHVIEALIPHVLPQSIKRFRQTYPGVTFEITLGGSDAVTAVVRNGDTDIGLTYTTPTTPGVHIAYRIPGPQSALMRPDHPLAAQDVLGVADLAPWPVGVATRPTATRQLFDDACHRTGIELAPVVASNSVDFLRRFAGDDGCVAVTSHLVALADLDAGTLVARRFKERELNSGYFDIVTTAGRKPSFAAERFLSHLGQEFEHVGEE